MIKDEKDKERVITLAKGGATLRDIMSETGIDKRCVWETLNQAGIKTPKAPRQVKVVCTVDTLSYDMVLLKDYLESAKKSRRTHRVLLFHLDNGCISSDIRKNSAGYNYTFLNRKLIMFHRYVLQQHTGESGEGKMALHSCGNPACLNPNHLRWGDYKDNSDDKYLHGTMRLGERVHSTKLTKEIVYDYKFTDKYPKDYIKCASILGVSPNTLRLIVGNKTWRWVTA
jgi:hypothetical protein